MATKSVSRGKVTKHGIEVPSALTYKSWEPGGEYTKPLVLKNVHLTSKKIRYKWVNLSEITSFIVILQNATVTNI